ncbi:MAG TPA: PilZ domain-containing protein [candidate division Zixibacteria bacterium]|nr:PilZ domain-containing protein [candidate division Zixibacteria bacterium]
MDEQENEAFTNKRRHPRKKPINYIEIYDSETDEFLGSLADLNIGGLRLLAQHELARNRTYSMRMRLPRSVDETEEIFFSAACRWQLACTSALLRGSYHIGLEIVDIAPFDADMISSLLASSWFRDWRQLPDYDRMRRETGYPEE